MPKVTSATTKRKKNENNTEIMHMVKKYNKKRENVVNSTMKLALNPTAPMSDKEHAQKFTKMVNKIAKTNRTKKKCIKPPDTHSINEQSKVQYVGKEQLSKDDPTQLMSDFISILKNRDDDVKKTLMDSDQQKINIITKGGRVEMPENCTVPKTFTFVDCLLAEFHELYLISMKYKNKDASIQELYDSDVFQPKGHVCAIGRCHFLCYPYGTCFKSFYCNPALTFRATGLVYVCSESGIAHICNANVVHELSRFALPPCNTEDNCCIMSGYAVRHDFEYSTVIDKDEDEDEAEDLDVPLQETLTEPTVIQHKEETNKHKDFVIAAMKHASNEIDADLDEKALSRYSNIVRKWEPIDMNKIETCVRKILLNRPITKTSGKRGTMRTLMQQIQAYVNECQRKKVPIFYDVLESIEAMSNQERQPMVFSVDDKNIKLYSRYVSVVMKFLNKTIIVNNSAISNWYEPISFTVLYIMSNGGLVLNDIQMLPAVPELSLHVTFLHKNNHCNSVNTYQDKIIAAYKSVMETIKPEVWYKLAFDKLVVDK